MHTAFPFDKQERRAVPYSIWWIRPLL